MSKTHAPKMCTLLLRLGIFLRKGGQNSNLVTFGFNSLSPIRCFHFQVATSGGSLLPGNTETCTVHRRLGFVNRDKYENMTQFKFIKNKKLNCGYSLLTVHNLSSINSLSHESLRYQHCHLTRDDSSLHLIKGQRCFSCLSKGPRGTDNKVPKIPPPLKVAIKFHAC